MADIDASIPPWLQRNWSPQQTFDPTPWLQERYNRQIQAQTLPLQLQGMALRNQQLQLDASHQAVMNDMLNEQQKRYAQELPRFNQLVQESKGDPDALANSTETFVNPVLQQRWMDLKKQAADTLLVQTKRANALEQVKTANDLERKGFGPIAIDPQSGLPVPESMQEAQAKYLEFQKQQAQTRYGWHMTYDENGNLVPTAVATAAIRADAATEAARIRANAVPGAGVEPQVKVVEGQKFLINPKTGHWEHLEKHLSRPEFIEKHALKWASDNMMTPEAAADALGKFYDASLGGGGTAPAPGAVKDIGGFKVRVKSP